MPYTRRRAARKIQTAFRAFRARKILAALRRKRATSAYAKRIPGKYSKYGVNRGKASAYY